MINSTSSLGERQFSFETSSLEQTSEVGSKIASMLSFPCCVFLIGDLGAGKTSLVKSVINSLGYAGDVTSPTYNLIQEYQVEQGMVYHMDLYRLEDPSELEFLGLEDLWTERSMFLIEWPEKGEGFLQSANIEIRLNKLFDSSPNHRNIVLKYV